MIEVGLHKLVEEVRVAFVRTPVIDHIKDPINTNGSFLVHHRRTNPHDYSFDPTALERD
jgi:hypothetical protein